MNAAAVHPTPHHGTLAGMVGTWSGKTRTWLDPAAAPEESQTDLVAQAICGGRWIRIEYQSAVMGAPHEGQFLIGFHKDAQEFEVMWVDGFHTGTSMMCSVGSPREDGAIGVLGHYSAGGQRWGWRTIFRKPREGELIIEAYNISPAGQEDRAIETRLVRR
jgi:hypothetical protein